MMEKEKKVDLLKELKKDAKVSLEKKKKRVCRWACVCLCKWCQTILSNIKSVYRFTYGKSVEELVNEIFKQREINKTQKTNQ